VARSGAVSTGLADDLAQVLDLLCKLTISGDPAVYPFAGVQYRCVITAEAEADLRQARAVHHFKSQQLGEMARQHDAPQVTPTE